MAVDELTPDERAELERLRAEVEALRGREQRPRRRPWRWTLAVLLIVLGSALAPLAVTAVWLKSEVSDTERYVATVAPLAHDPALQRAVTDRVTAEVFARLDIAALTDQLADALARQGVPEAAGTAVRGLRVPIANGLEGWVHDQIARFVASDEFARAWAEANRAAHTQLVAVLTGQDTGAVVVRGDTVSVKLATFINAVKERLVARGFALAANIPAVDAEFVILRSADVGKVQRYFRLLDTLGTWLPVLALALLAGGGLAAPSRRRGIVAAGLGVAAGMLLLGAALALARPLYLRSVPPDALPSDAAAAVFDTLVVYLRTTLRALLATAVIVAAAAYLSGPAPAAVAVRRAVTRGLARVREGAGRRGLRTGPVGTWVGRHKPASRVAVVAVAAGVLVFWDYPTAAVVAVVALGVVLALVLIELVGVPPQPRSQS